MSHSSSQPRGQGQGPSNDNGRHRPRFSPNAAARRARLRDVAKETIAALPAILGELPDLDADKSTKYDFNTMPRLDPADCPKLETKATVRVVNQDSFNAALDVASQKHAGRPAGRVAVLNLASHRNPGGGWLNGAAAQEEALCYRSSLSRSLHRRDYPMKKSEGHYTRDVLIIRTGMDDGHTLMVPEIAPADLHVVSVVSVAALNRPGKKKVQVADGGSGGSTRSKEVFDRAEDRELTKDKMRLTLRMAALNGHRTLVLGAMGCGAFQNPVEDVAECWREVLTEEEFAAGWWQEVWFAVYDRRNEGNFDVFARLLGGLKV